jgi:hypothetical protein
MSDPQPPIELGYESASDEPPPKRPVWVWIVVVLYLLIVAPITTLFPAWIAISSPDETALIFWSSVTALVMTAAAIGLLLTPVRMGRRRPFKRRSVWIPIVSAGLLMGILVVGAGLALIEYFHDDQADEIWFYGVWIGGGAVWVAWSIVLWLLTGFRDPTSVVAHLHRWVLGGSVAELLVAVPAHLVVRKRPYCCAGIYTGTAIAFGVIAMIIAFGPSVGFLFYRRWKRIAPPTLTNDETRITNQ